MQVTVVVHDVGGVGGMERVLTELIEGLLAAGDVVTVISRTCALTPHDRLRWVRVPGPARPLPLAYPWFFAVGSLITWRRRRGVVLSTGAIVANRTDWTAVHLCHHAARDLGVSRMSRRSRVYRINAHLAQSLSCLGERFCYRPSRAGGLIGVSSGVAAELSNYFPRMRVATVPNGVSVERFQPDPARRRDIRRCFGIRDDELLALFVGGEWKGKGLSSAIRGLAHAPGWKLCVVGAGDAGTYAAVADAAGVHDRVLFAGVVDDPAPFYAASDAFVLPSIYETFSLVTYEAAASGVPLLATPVSGVTDLLSDGETGWFIHADPADIGSKLVALGNDRDMRARMAQAGRAAAAQFSWPQMLTGYQRLFREAATRYDTTGGHPDRALRRRLRYLGFGRKDRGRPSDFAA